MKEGGWMYSVKFERDLFGRERNVVSFILVLMEKI